MVGGRFSHLLLFLIFGLGISLSLPAQDNLYEHLLDQMESATRQQNHSEAISLGLDLVTSTTRNNATSNPRIPNSFVALGRAYSAAGQYAEATKWFRKALAHHQQYHDEPGPELAGTYRAFAANYLASGRPELAEPYLNQALELLASTDIDSNPIYADALMERSSLYFFRKNWDAAIQDLQAAMAIQEKIHGLQSAELARALINLGGIYMQQGDFPKVKAVYSHALNMQKAVLGDDDPEIATTYVNLAVYYDQMGEFAQAEDYLEQALALREKALGYTHPLTGAVVDDLVSLDLSIGSEAQASARLDRLRDERLKVLGGDHPAVAEVLDKRASMALVQGQPKLAEAYMQEALQLRQNYYGPTHDRVAASLYGLGKLQNLMGKYEQARVHLVSALDVYQNQELEAEEAISALLAELILNGLAMGQNEEVGEYFGMLVNLKEMIYGEDHPAVVPALQEYLKWLDQQSDAAWQVKANGVRAQIAAIQSSAARSPGFNE